MWQEIIVGICVLLAVVYVLRQWLPGLGRKGSGCGGCSGCESNAKSCHNPDEQQSHQSKAVTRQTP